MLAKVLTIAIGLACVVEVIVSYKFILCCLPPEPLKLHWIHFYNFTPCEHSTFNSI